MVCALADVAAVLDISIIGGGPRGLFATLYAGLRQMSVKIIDSLDVPGGQFATLYPEKYIYDVPEFPEVLAKDLPGNLAEQAITASLAICLGETVRRLDFEEQSQSYRIHT